MSRKVNIVMKNKQLSRKIILSRKVAYHLRIYFNLTNDTIATSVVATTACDHIIFLNGMNKSIYVFDPDTKVIGGCNIKVPDSYLHIFQSL